MRLPTKARNALHAMLVVARESNGGKPVNLGVVSERTVISRRNLEQVSIFLKKGGLLRAVAGKNGGHMLTRPAEDIRLSEIIEAVIGRINIVECINNPQSCPVLEGCEFRIFYLLINQQIREAFCRFTLADLVEHRIELAVVEEGVLAGREAAAL